LATPSKIEFYREVLRDDPASRVFFPLARMLAQDGQTEEAVTILTRAINVHPGHLEARFFLVELLTKLGLAGESESVFKELLPLLSNYPSVWSLWAAKAQGLSRDSSVAMHLVARNLGGAEISFVDLLEKGLSATARPNPGAPQGTAQTTPHASKIAREEVLPPAYQAASDGRSHHDEPLPETPAVRPNEFSGTGGTGGAGFEDFSLRGASEVQMLARRIQEEGGAQAERVPVAESQVKTRTMADLLAKGGDYAQALRIYKDLMEQSPDPGEREMLARRIIEIEMSARTGVRQAPAEPSPKREDRSDLRSALEALAGRLDARAAG